MNQATMKTSRRKKADVKFVISKVVTYLLLTALTVIALLPFVWMISSSLKSSIDVFSIPMRWIPESFRWENYVEIWQKVPLVKYFQNTVIVALVVTFMQIVTSSFAAYAFAKMQFKGRDVLFMCYIGTIAVPWQVYMVPQFIMMRSVGLYDTLWSLVALQSFSAFGVFLMRQFYLGIPNDLSEAARIDGLSEYGIWARIILPLAKPAIATLTIFTFVNTWNDYMGPMIYLTTDSVKTIQLGLRRFIQAYTAEYNLIMAASLCSLIPVTVVFLFLQRYFIEGIATTGMKG
ncbi:MAG: carbohydrate ABC transporter permease [Clostridia bacterium]|nr:carbohydrate ABC transporter permease [Clostridia bacterium]